MPVSCKTKNTADLVSDYDFTSPPLPPHLTKDLPLPIKCSTYSQGKPKFKK